MLVCLNSQTEINQLDVAIFVVHHISWFNISVDYILPVTVIKSAQTFFNNLNGSLFTKLFVVLSCCFTGIKKGATLTHLHHQIQKSLIAVRLDVLDDVWVVNSLHNANFILQTLYFMQFHL